MIMPMLSRKTFSTNSLKYNFLQDVWFGHDAGYSKTQSTPNDSNSSIDLLRSKQSGRFFQISVTFLKYLNFPTGQI
jgi:hypothetical protein